MYFIYGMKATLECSFSALIKYVDLYMDGIRIELPQVASIVILNICSYAGGVQPWTCGQGRAYAPKQDFSDGLLEVLGFTSALHVGLLKLGVGEPIRLGQGSEIKLHLKNRVPMQVDGEPWEQEPGTITVTHSYQAPVLIGNQ